MNACKAWCRSVIFSLSMARETREGLVSEMLFRYKSPTENLSLRDGTLICLKTNKPTFLWVCFLLPKDNINIFWRIKQNETILMQHVPCMWVSIKHHIGTVGSHIHTKQDLSSDLTELTLYLGTHRPGWNLYRSWHEKIRSLPPLYRSIFKDSSKV